MNKAVVCWKIGTTFERIAKSSQIKTTLDSDKARSCPSFRFEPAGLCFKSIILCSDKVLTSSGNSNFSKLIKKVLLKRSSEISTHTPIINGSGKEEDGSSPRTTCHCGRATSGSISSGQEADAWAAGIECKKEGVCSEEVVARKKRKFSVLLSRKTWSVNIITHWWIIAQLWKLKLKANNGTASAAVTGRTSPQLQQQTTRSKVKKKVKLS